MTRVCVLLKLIRVGWHSIRLPLILTGVSFGNIYAFRQIAKLKSLQNNFSGIRYYDAGQTIKQFGSAHSAFL